jgi:hypothetical protein
MTWKDRGLAATPDPDAVVAEVGVVVMAANDIEQGGFAVSAPAYSPDSVPEQSSCWRSQSSVAVTDGASRQLKRTGGVERGDGKSVRLRPPNRCADETDRKDGKVDFVDRIRGVRAAATMPGVRLASSRRRFLSGVGRFSA